MLILYSTFGFMIACFFKLIIVSLVPLNIPTNLKLFIINEMLLEVFIVRNQISREHRNVILSTPCLEYERKLDK